MKRAFVLIASFTALSALTLAFDATSDFKKFLTAAKPKMEKAFANEDIKFFENSSTPDFTETQGGMTSKKKDALAGLKQFFGMCSGIKMKSEILSCSAKGKTGNASMHSTMTATVTTPGSKTSAKWEMEMWEKQVWVMSGKSWKLKSIGEDKPMKMKINGKSVNPSQVMGGGGN